MGCGYYDRIFYLDRVTWAVLFVINSTNNQLPNTVHSECKCVGFQSNYHRWKVTNSLKSNHRILKFSSITPPPIYKCKAKYFINYVGLCVKANDVFYVR